ncbi:MAG TPA: trigger factor [Candidatus Gastranaerophilales bacterium]|nr:trigger factor [Candidatus Gastranaerophilales bacterium]
MNTNLEKIDNNQFKLSIEIDAEIASLEYNKACKKLGENVNIPGFRKGKTPRPIIEKHVGMDRIKQKAIDVLLPPIIADVISENQLDLITEPVLEAYDFQLGKPVVITTKIEVKPEVKLPEYKGLTIEVPEFKAKEDSVEKELEAVRNKFSRLEQVIGRQSRSNDIVFIDFNGSINGEPIKGGAGKNHQLDIANSHFIPGFAEQLIDKNIGDEFKINVTFPEDYHDKNIAGKEAEFAIKINEIKEKILPELNDEFAQKLGPFQTMDDFKNHIKGYVDKSQENENRVRAEKILVDKIIDETKLDIPDTMINREAKYLMEEIETRFKNQGLSWEQVIEQQGHENIWNNLREEAARRVKTSLVLSAIAKGEGITLTEEDFTLRIKELAQAYNTEESKVYEQMSKNIGLAQGLSQQIMSQKIINYLLENNEVKYIEDISK